MSNPYAAPIAQDDPSDAVQIQPLGVLFGFSGRIARRHYWMGNGVIAAVFGAIHLMQALFGESELVSLIFLFSFLPIIWIRFALMAKRFHDLNHSGAAVLAMFIPGFGALIVFVLCGLTRGTQGPNDYGPDPT